MSEEAGRSGYAASAGKDGDSTASSTPAFTSDVVPVDRAPVANNETRTDSTQQAMSAGEAHQDALNKAFEGANPTTQAKNTLVDKPTLDAGHGAPPGQKPIGEAQDDPNRTVAAPVTEGRVGPGTGDGEDTRPLGDPTAPQGTGPEVPGQATPPVHMRPAPAGKIRVSHAESGDFHQ